jgi:FAD:protein FMN transferase
MTTFQAMGTSVWVHGGSADQVAAWFEQVENVCSRFRPDSELSHLNASSPGWSPVSPLLHTVLAAADEARMMSDGLVDPAIGAAVEAWGYDRSFELVTDKEAAPGPVPSGSWTLGNGSVWRSTGTRLDLGGVAKGWACDRAVDTGLATAVNAGGDLRSNHPDLRVEVLHPDGTIAATVQLGQGALATSSTARRRWQAGNRTASHLVDPRTGEPVESPVQSATALTATAVEAEVAAKAMLLSGVDSLAWAEEQSWVRAGLVVWWDGTVFATPGMELAA